jgi:hypothetical protein
MSDDVKHSPEPWVAEVDAVLDAGGFVCAEGWPGDTQGMWTDGGEDGPVMNLKAYEAAEDANARRIVACVNALAGIPTAALEEGALAKALDEIGRFRLAMVELDEVKGHPWPHICDRIAGISAALGALGRLP